MNKPTLEVWQRGPVENVPLLLQPVAHALLQAAEEIEGFMEGFPDDLLWKKPSGVASVAFHLQHITGVINRLFTYARGEALAEAQLEKLSFEGKQTALVSTQDLVKDITNEIQVAIDQLRNTSESSLLDFRGIGRKQIPSNVLGLLFHAAEHTQRHTGQLYVTVRMVKSGNFSEAG